MYQYFLLLVLGTRFPHLENQKIFCTGNNYGPAKGHTLRKGFQCISKKYRLMPCCACSHEFKSDVKDNSSSRFSGWLHEVDFVKPK